MNHQAMNTWRILKHTPGEAANMKRLHNEQFQWYGDWWERQNYRNVKQKPETPVIAPEALTGRSNGVG